MSEWRPIETAPRDGKPILLWLKDEGFCVKGRWVQCPEREQDEPEWMWFLPEMGVYQTDDGLHWITHWTPLPDPPKAP